MSGYAPDDPTAQPPEPPGPPAPVRIAVRYIPELGHRRVFIVNDDQELDISASVDRIKGFDLDPRGPSQITLQLKADVEDLDWVYQTVGVLGDPMAVLDREDMQAVIAQAITGAGFAESAEIAATTAVLEHLRNRFARRA